MLSRQFQEIVEKVKSPIDQQEFEVFYEKATSRN